MKIDKLYEEGTEVFIELLNCMGVIESYCLKYLRNCELKEDEILDYIRLSMVDWFENAKDAAQSSLSKGLNDFQLRKLQPINF